jgi:uncharacterized protein YndB with AHSA1/START domain
MAALTSAIEVARPPEAVFAYVTDPARFGEWQANVTGGHMEGGGPYGPGAQCRTTRRIGFADRTVTSEITHVDPPRRWGVRGVDGPIRAIVDVVVDPIEDGRASRLTINIGFHGHGIGKLVVPLAVRPQARKEMPANLERLKQRVEVGSGQRTQ